PRADQSAAVRSGSEGFRGVAHQPARSRRRPAARRQQRKGLAGPAADACRRSQVVVPLLDPQGAGDEPAHPALRGGVDAAVIDSPGFAADPPQSADDGLRPALHREAPAGGLQSLMSIILIHTLVFPPDSVSTAYLMGDLASELKKRGHEVKVLTATPHY